MGAFRLITFGSPEYEQECLLRHEVLRKPLGLSLWDEELSKEGQDMHLGLFSDEGTIDACGVAAALQDGQIKLRQIAVRKDKQGKGIGRKLMEEVEEVAREMGFEEIVLHSRVTVVGFYHGLGYENEGDEFEEVGLAHQKMRKKMKESGNENSGQKGSTNTTHVPRGIALGFGVGLIAGIIFGNIGLGIALGGGFGAAFGICMGVANGPREEG